MTVRYADTFQVKSTSRTRKKMQKLLDLMSAEKGCVLSQAAAFDLLVQYLNPEAVRDLVQKYDQAMAQLERPVAQIKQLEEV